MDEWHSVIRPEDSFWQDYAEPLAQLKAKEFPTAERLNELLSDSVCNQQGLPIRFVPSKQISDSNYEVHIFDTGQVSTREESWHDLFNALVWSRFPGLKSAINATHVAAMTSGCEPGRGKRRDALTLFDECGVIVVAEERAPLELLAARDWHSVFQQQPETWRSGIRIFVTGHAMLEKFLSPYKSMTANALLVQITKTRFSQTREELRTYLDEALAQELNSSALLSSSKDLSPLPLMGIPGWWLGGDQDQQFYDDKQVFRPASEGFIPAPVFSLPEHQI